MTMKKIPGSKKTDEERSDIGGGVFNSLTGFIYNSGDLAGAGERLSQRQG